MSVLDTFRNPPDELLLAEGLVDQFGVSLQSIQNKTGDPSDCGMTDTQGNIAYFNKLCAGSINGNQLLSAASAFGGISDNTNQTIPSGSGTWTPRTWNSLPAGWVPGPAFDYSNQGIRLNKLGLYLLEADFHATGTSTNWYTGIQIGAGPSPIVAAITIVPLSAVGQIGLTHFYLNTVVGTIITLAATGNTNYQLDGTYLYAAFLMS